MEQKIVVVVEPATLALDLTKTKAYLRVDGTDEDTVIQTMISAATRIIEDYLSLKVISQTCDVIMDQFPMTHNELWFDGTQELPISAVTSMKRNIVMPIGNVTSIVSFKTYSDDTEFTHTLSDYIFDTDGKLCRFALKLGGFWPVTILRGLNGIKVRVVAGWTDETAVPQDISQAIKEFVAHMYENRGDQKEMVMPPHVSALLYHRRKLLV